MSDPHYHRLVKSVARALVSRCSVREAQHLLVAVSGGADSVALLRSLTALAPRRRWRLQLTVAHIDHALRPDSRADRDFVQQLAYTLRLPFYHSLLDLDETPGNLEAAARTARYAALEQLADEAEADLIVTAHHQDDQLETLLMRLLRGTSVTGLAAIHPVIGRVIRPMLDVDRATVIDYLQTLNQPWCEDPTNRDTRLLRNRLRHEVLPILRELRPDVAAKAAQLTDHARLLNDWIEQQVDHHTPGPPGTPGIPGHDLKRPAARAMHPLLLSAVLRRMLSQTGVGPDHISQSTLTAIVRSIQDSQGGERTFQFNASITLTVDHDVVRVEKLICNRL